MERISPSELARRKSAIVRRYVTINGRNSSVCLESAFWDALKEIADIRGATRATIVSTIESEGRPCNLSSAILCSCWTIIGQKIDSVATLDGTTTSFECSHMDTQRSGGRIRASDTIRATTMCVPHSGPISDSAKSKPRHP